MRTRISLTMVTWIAAVSLGRVQAEDNPVFRSLVAKAITKKLAKHDSETNAWHRRQRESKQRTERLGRIAVRMRWTEEHQAWVWVESPDRNLTIEVSRLEMKDGRFHFALKVAGRAHFRFRSKIEGLVSAEFRGKARAEMAAQGSLALNGEGQVAEAKVTTLDAKLIGLDIASDRLLGVLLTDAANLYLQRKQDRFKREIEKALNGLEI